MASTLPLSLSKAGRSAPGSQGCPTDLGCSSRAPERGRALLATGASLCAAVGWTGVSTQGLGAVPQPALAAQGRVLQLLPTPEDGGPAAPLCPVPTLVPMSSP